MKKQLKAQAGFTIIEVIIAAVILAVGILGTMAVFTQAVIVTKHSQEELIAKQKAQEVLEGIYTARNTQQITFDMIQNVSKGGIFLDGAQPLQSSGPNGIVGTGDDGAVETISMPGPDGLLGTADDITRTLNEFDRQIAITNFVNPDGSVNPDLRNVTVTVRYFVGNVLQRQYQVSGLISRYR